MVTPTPKKRKTKARGKNRPAGAYPREQIVGKSCAVAALVITRG